MKKYTYRELVKLIESNGYEFVSHKKHAKYAKGSKTLVIPKPNGELSRPLVKRILKEAGIEG